MFQATESSRHGHTGPDVWEPSKARASVVLGAPLFEGWSRETAPAPPTSAARPPMETDTGTGRRSPVSAKMETDTGTGRFLMRTCRREKATCPRDDLMARAGLEPATPRFSAECSTS